MSDEDFSPEVREVLQREADKITGGVPPDQADQPPQIVESGDGPVTLPIGLRRINADLTFTEITEAWVKELDGYAEEAIFKARRSASPTAFFQSILTAGVDRLGDAKPSKEELDRLTVGDRDYLLVRISIATYGNDIPFKQYPCPQCMERLDFIVNKSKDIPVKMGSLDDLEFDVELRREKKARVRLSDAADQKAMEGGKDPSEMNTLLLNRCVLSVTGEHGNAVLPSDDPEVVKRMGLADREKILTTMAEKAAGPQYNDVDLTCPECGAESKVVVTLADLFPGL